MSAENDDSEECIHTCMTFEEALFDAVERDDDDRIRSFVDWGYDITYHERQVNILQASCCWNAPKVLAECIKQGMDINEPEFTQEKTTPIITALLLRHRECMDLLFAANVDVNVKYRGLASALELYVDIEPSIDSIKFMLRRGARVHDLIVEKYLLRSFVPDQVELIPQVRDLMYAAGAISLYKLQEDQYHEGLLRAPRRLEEISITKIRDIFWDKKNNHIFHYVDQLPDEFASRPFPPWLKSMLTFGHSLAE